MATLLKVLNNLADIRSAGGVALHVRTQGVAVLMIPAIEYACGKLPQSSPVSGGMSSDRSPNALWRPRIASNNFRASSFRPMRQSASVYQKLHAKNAVSGAPKSSSAV